MKRIELILKYILYKYILKKDIMEIKIEYYRNKGVKIGNNVRAFSSLISAEPYLLEFGNNVTVSTGVKFTTHDNSVIKVIDNATDVFGKIKIGDNCFIGQNSLILPGVTLGNNIIVGAGSIVTKSFLDDGIIIAGNPAKKIGNIDTYNTKIKDYCINTKGLSYNEKKLYIMKNKEKLIKK